MGIQDKRRHLRVEASLDVRFSIQCSETSSEKVATGKKKILGLARTKNISIGGMYLKLTGSPYDTRMSLTPANAQNILGKPIEVWVEQYNLEIWGEVIRVETPALDIGMVISKVSDVNVWKRLCSENIDGLSIFPDTVRSRRMRRT